MNYALVTGGSRGLGAAISKRLAKQGLGIIVNYRSNESAAKAVADEIIGDGGIAELLPFDVSSEESVDMALEKWEETHPDDRITVLVNNAGITKDKLVPMMKVPDFDSVVDTNLKGAFYMIKQLYPVFMKQKSGKIINISSVSGLMGNPGQTNYSASKAGLIGLTKSVAKELASRNVNCNAIAPGFVATDMTENLSENNALVDHIPMKRFAQPEDIANLALFLASDQSDYITGEVIRIDGGLAM